MPECAKTHLQQCKISSVFPGEDPGLPGRGEKRQRGEGREEKGGEEKGGERNEGKKGEEEGKGGRRRPLASGPQNHNPPLHNSEDSRYKMLIH